VAGQKVLSAANVPSAGFSQQRSNHYARAMERAPNARTAELDKLQAVLDSLGVTQCRRIVDLGAGHGYATITLVDYLAHDGVVFGIDTSPDMVGRIPHHANIRTMIAPLDELDIEAETVDLAVSLATFHHVTHKTLVMREIKRILRSGGYVVIADVNEGTPTQQFFDHVVRRYCATGHDLDFLDQHWIKLIAQRAGMEHISSSVERTDWRFESESAMLEFLRSLMYLEIEVGRLKLMVDTLLQPRADQSPGTFTLPWWLGYHALRKD
jgi:SAM-dependent methyltransferase